MNSPNDDPDRASNASTVLIVTQIVISITSLFALILSLFERIYLSIQLEIALAALGFGALYVLLAIFLLRRLRRIRRYSFRLAVTGQPQAGKTVFSVLAFDALMNERTSGVSFSAESRSLIAVYQAVRNLPSGKWPKATAKGNVSTYEGELSLARTRIGLEIGDSAGEYWLDFNDDAERDPGYVEYVISSNGIAHVIPLDELMWEEQSQEILRRDVEDLQLVSRLKRSARSQPAEIPLLIVLSKADLVFPLEELTDSRSGLFAVVPSHELLELPVLGTYSKYSRTFDQLSRIADRLEGEFLSVHFLLSSGPAIAAGRLDVAERSGDLVKWIVAQSRRARSSNRNWLSGVIGSK